MTLYELLHKVSFDEIAPFLSKSYVEGRSLAWFKMHYDYLRHLVPQQNEHNDKIIVYLIPPAVDSPRITITAFLEKTLWKSLWAGKWLWKIMRTSLWLRHLFYSQYVVQNTLLKDRILVEEIPSSRHFLTDIVDAMKGNNVIMATYRNFHYKNSYTFPIAPYCLKMFQKRWYVLALSINEDRLRIYGLDRFENIEITKDHFKFPIDFNAKDYFSSFFGVVIDEDIPLQRIVVRAFGAHQHYMRSLPLHLSQKELCSCNEYADFELTLRPTYDFIMELQSYGTMIEVMEPQSLRQTMKCCISDLCKLYDPCRSQPSMTASDKSICFRAIKKSVKP